MHTLLLSFLAYPVAFPTAGAAAVPEPFVTDWQFTRDAVFVAAASAVDYDAAGWRVVRVPHDWAICGPFDESMDGSTGKLPWRGQGWYRRVFTLDAADEGKRIYFDFDGVMAFPKVYVNGELAGEWDYGYTPFRVDATEYVRWGQANTIVVHVDTERWGSRWYLGAGIYRKVELTIDEPVHIALWGTRITTNGNEPGGHPADQARVETTIENHLDRPQDAVVRLVLVAPDGTVLGTKTQPAHVRYLQMLQELDFPPHDPL